MHIFIYVHIFRYLKNNRQMVGSKDYRQIEKARHRKANSKQLKGIPSTATVMDNLRVKT